MLAYILLRIDCAYSVHAQYLTDAVRQGKLGQVKKGLIMKKIFAAFAVLGFTAATAVAQVHVSVRTPPPPQVVVSVPAPPRVVVSAPAPHVVVVPQRTVYVDDDHDDRRYKKHKKHKRHKHHGRGNGHHKHGH